MTARTLITLTGASCAGKTTLARLLTKAGVPEVRSFTTRPMRHGEVNGQDYDFLSDSEVLTLEESRKVVERTSFGGHFYGITQDALDAAFASSDLALIIVEPNGLRQMRAEAKRFNYTVFAVLVTAPLVTCIERMLVRYSADASAAFAARYAQRLLHLVQFESRSFGADSFDWIVDNHGPQGPERFVQEILTAIPLKHPAVKYGT